MDLKTLLKLFAVLTAVIFAGIFVYFWNYHSGVKEFHALLAGPSSPCLKTFFISGQGTNIWVVDPKMLSHFDRAFSHRSTNLVSTGISYDVHMKFVSGHTFESYIMVNSNYMGFVIADEPDPWYNDPLYIVVEFEKPVDPELANLIYNLASPKDSRSNH